MVNQNESNRNQQNDSIKGSKENPKETDGKQRNPHHEVPNIGDNNKKKSDEEAPQNNTKKKESSNRGEGNTQDRTSTEEQQNPRKGNI